MNKLEFPIFSSTMRLFSVIFVALVTPKILSGIQSVDAAHISTHGNIIIGGLFPVHKEGEKENLCGSFNEIPGYQYMEAMLYAIDNINTRTDILPGIKLGTVIYDTCRSPTISADNTKEFIKFTLSPPVRNGSHFAGVIGPFKSGNSIIVANFLRVFEIPQISYASLSAQLSDKRFYSNFYRTVPPDTFFAVALAALLKRLGWTFVSIIYSKGTYPESGTEEVVKALTKKGICVARKHRLPRFPAATDYDKAMMAVAAIKEANVVVFITIQRDSRELLLAKKRLPLAERLSLVGSVSWSNRDDITNGLGDVADGTITFGHQEGNIKEFEEYFRSLNLSNYNANYKGWFREFWQKQFNCSLGNASEKYTKQCSGKESLLKERMEIAPVRVVINAVNAMAYALDNMQKHLCPNDSSLCENMSPLPRALLQKFLKNVTFPDCAFNWPIRFDENNEVEGNYTVLNFRESARGIYKYVPVGAWTSRRQPNGDIVGHFNSNFSNIRWSNGNVTVPASFCSFECDEKSVRLPRVGFPRMCCWNCEPCKRYDLRLNNTCQSCAVGFVPDKNSSSCLKLVAKSINMDTSLSIFLVFFSCLGILADLAVGAVFLINSNHEVIKASNQRMCYVIMLGLCLVFLIPFAFLSRPTQNLCYIQVFLLGTSFAVCYASLLVKITSSYLLFRKQNETAEQQPNFIGSQSQLLATIGLITIQLLLCLLISTQTPLRLRETFNEESEELLLECPVDRPLVAYLAFIILLLLACTGFAFISRSIPNNFREAMYIGVTMYSTNVLWVVFLACFVNTTRASSRAYLTAGLSVVIGWITLVGIFAPKVYLIKKSGSLSFQQ